MTAEKRYKRIGWVVERKHRAWFDCPWSFSGWTRSGSIQRFNDNPARRRKYEYYRRKGLARCVKVYVEVKDG